jgi:hypothetical protein
MNMHAAQVNTGQYVRPMTAEFNEFDINYATTLTGWRLREDVVEGFIYEPNDWLRMMEKYQFVPRCTLPHSADAELD